MASAWEQLGEIDRINQLRRQAQLARAVNGVYYTKHFSRFSDETLLKVFGAAQSRVVVETIDANNVTTRALLSQKISNSVIPDRSYLRTDAPLDESAQQSQLPASNLSPQHRLRLWPS